MAYMSHVYDPLQLIVVSPNSLLTPTQCCGSSAYMKYEQFGIANRLRCWLFFYDNYINLGYSSARIGSI